MIAQGFGFTWDFSGVIPILRTAAKAGILRWRRLCKIPARRPE